MIGFIILISLVIAIVILIWVVYNRLVKQKNLVAEAWSTLDVCLKKRHELVPNLVAVVQGIATHEKELFVEVSKWRSKAMQPSNAKEQENAENMLSSALGKISVVIENYPNLISGENFVKLQGQLFEIEDEIAYARRYYNGTIRNNNILIESFPSNLVANMFDFEKPSFFELEISSERNAPEINFDEDEA